MPHPPFITLDDKSEAPFYRQIYETIRRSILSGGLSSGRQLPASRLLAKQLGVSRMTVVNAYEQLLAEGYLEGRIGAGTFVSAHLPEEFLQASGFKRLEHQEKQSARKVILSRYGTRLAQNSRVILQHHCATALEPFQHGVAALDEFPFGVWSKIAQKWQKHPSSTVLSYGDAVGFQPLRDAVAAHLAAARGVRCTPDQIIITNGTQQALDLITRVFLSESEDVCLEDPGYIGARDIFAATGARIIPVPIDDEGFDLQAARKRSQNARLIYVTPSHQFPLGVTMSLARRLSLLEWARERDAFVIEDDYNSEYRYAGRPLASLQGLDRDGRVIYVGTFSKTIFPALRLGYLVVPLDLMDVFASARALTDLHSPLIEQAVLAEFIAERHFARHIRRMRGMYEERQQTLVEEARKNLGDMLEVAPAKAGMHLIGWLPGGIGDREVSLRAAEAGLNLAPVSAYCIEQNLRGGLLLGYTAYDEKHIKQGMKKLARVLSELIRA
ncbi:MAG: GntR family transcriptional regulator / MocR family aminotransferase [Blastocatellia bacterium]|jgi:GntR family transcriptional regulator/MocR family aminotransferase|nr:GntR family transcriptional regulator / MocR family aminotransferase [Blastocatellia bacterium]